LRPPPPRQSFVSVIDYVPLAPEEGAAPTPGMELGAASKQLLAAAAATAPSDPPAAGGSPVMLPAVVDDGARQPRQPEAEEEEGGRGDPINAALPEVEVEAAAEAE
jgi:hypothetical protein